MLALTNLVLRHKLCRLGYGTRAVTLQRGACPYALLAGCYSRRGEIIGPSNEAILEIARRTDLHSRAGRKGREGYSAGLSDRSTIMTFLVARAWLPMLSPDATASPGMTPRRLAEDDNCWHLRKGMIDHYPYTHTCVEHTRRHTSADITVPGIYPSRSFRASSNSAPRERYTCCVRIILFIQTFWKIKKVNYNWLSDYLTVNKLWY